MLYIYILKLENDKYYVGKTTDDKKRIQTHFYSYGSQWTKLHKPISVAKIIENCNKFDEDKYVKICMDKYGIQNVRGGSYSQIILPIQKIKTLQDEINLSNDRCYICKKSGHFGKDCPNKDLSSNKYQQNNVCCKKKNYDNIIVKNGFIIKY